MCGIAGISWQDQKLIGQMTGRLNHRGPDSQGLVVENGVSLGHTRLKIVDLSSRGAQPMKYKHLTISFNGEIYNYKQLRHKLQAQGYRFSSQTDTEVILKGYHHFGDKLTKHLRGMWAFVIHDHREHQLFLSRDHFGIKPLYYRHQGREFAFASQISALPHKSLFQLDPLSLNAYFFHRYIPQPQTIYSQVKALPPGYNGVYELKTGRLKLKSYYHLSQAVARQSHLSVNQVRERLAELLPQIVAEQLVADVRVGVFLSGGLDSSLLSSLAQKIHPQIETFGIGFSQPSYDETNYAQLVADRLGLKYHSQIIKLDDQLIANALDNLDQPLADPALLPTYALSQHARSRLTVALSGDGADEVFGGYDTYRAAAIAKHLPPMLPKLLQPLSHLLSEGESKVSQVFMLKRFLERYHPNPTWRHHLATAIAPEASRRQLLTQAMISDSSLTSLSSGELADPQRLDINMYLPGDILPKTDLASMAFALEVRVPYLDHRLVELGLSLPQTLRFGPNRGKVWLKQYAQSFLPSEVVNRPKRGLSVPLGAMLRESKLLKQMLLSQDSFAHLLLDRRETEKLYRQFVDKGNHSRILWTVAVFNYWWAHRSLK